MNKFYVAYWYNDEWGEVSQVFDGGDALTKANKWLSEHAKESHRKQVVDFTSRAAAEDYTKYGMTM